MRQRTEESWDFAFRGELRSSLVYGSTSQERHSRPRSAARSKHNCRSARLDDERGHSGHWFVIPTAVDKYKREQGPPRPSQCATHCVSREATHRGGCDRDPEAPIAELTSGDLGALKDLIKQVLAERETLRRSISRTHEELATARRRLGRARTGSSASF